MNKKAREAYNASFSEEGYNNLLNEIQTEFPKQLDFRVAESPVFVPKDLKIKMLMACNGIIDRIKKADFKSKTDAAIPKGYNFKNESENPHFLAIDFAVCKSENDDLEPQLIELQGFPSLFAYQNYLIGKYKKHFTVPAQYSAFFNRLNAFSYQQEMDNILKPTATKKTVLLEAYPDRQKTRLDFELSKAYWNIETVCLSQTFLKDGSLYYLVENKEVQIDAVYNRVIFDEIESTYPELKTKVEELKEANVEWISHPNWFYRISKYCMPLLKGDYIPQSFYLDSLDNYPEDLENYVLKPFFSFAGAGVNLNPTKEVLDAIENKQNYLLQEKVDYHPCIEDTNGGLIKAEIRMLFVWHKGKERPKLVTSLARLSRGEMIGVAHNKDFDWVGSSAAFFETT